MNEDNITQVLEEQEGRETKASLEILLELRIGYSRCFVKT